jgi:hypothetical protein
VALLRGTISKAIKTGKLSATREDGSWKIDNAELARYLEANQHRFRSDTVETDQVETGVGTGAATDALVAELRAVIADLRQDRDQWREQALRLALPAPKRDEQPMAVGNRWRRAWRWMQARG